MLGGVTYAGWQVEDAGYEDYADYEGCRVWLLVELFEIFPVFVGGLELFFEVLGIGF